MPTTQRELACPLCDGERWTPLVTGYDRVRANARDFPYVRCAGCGLVRQDPLPAPEEIPGFYPDGYGPHVGERSAQPRSLARLDKPINRLAVRYYYGTDSVRRSPLLRGLFRLVSGRVLAGTRPPLGKNRLLDVGCGAGGTLLTYRRLGWEVRGIEVDPRAAAVARERGLDVHCGTVDDAPFDAGAFDLVTLKHVVEHVLDPTALLRRAARFLAPGGRIVALTPNVDSLGFRMFGSCWYPLDAPRHLMLFDPRTIRRLAERAGLRVERLVTHGEPRLLSDSHRLRARQGERLPAGLEARRALVEGPGSGPRRGKAYRTWIAPRAHWNAKQGRGEVLEVDLVPRSADAGGARS